MQRFFALCCCTIQNVNWGMRPCGSPTALECYSNQPPCRLHLRPWRLAGCPVANCDRQTFTTCAAGRPEFSPHRCTYNNCRPTACRVGVAVGREGDTQSEAGTHCALRWLIKVAYFTHSPSNNTDQKQLEPSPHGSYFDALSKKLCH